MGCAVSISILNGTCSFRSCACACPVPVGPMTAYRTRPQEYTYTLILKGLLHVNLFADGFRGELLLRRRITRVQCLCVGAQAQLCIARRRVLCLCLGAQAQLCIARRRVLGLCLGAQAQMCIAG